MSHYIIDSLALDIFFGIILLGALLIKRNIDSENNVKKQSGPRNDEFFEGGDEEENFHRNTNGRLTLYRLFGNNLPLYRASFGHAIIYLLDSQHYEANIHRLDSIVSHFEGLDEIIDLAITTTIRRIDNYVETTINSLGVGIGLGGTGHSYMIRREPVNSNIYLRNNRLYLRFMTSYRNLVGRFASGANLPFNSIDRLYRAFRGLIRRGR